MRGSRYRAGSAGLGHEGGARLVETLGNISGTGSLAAKFRCLEAGTGVVNRGRGVWSRCVKVEG